jgi:membrane protease subunit HflC
MNIRSFFVLALVATVLTTLASALFIVNETQRGVLLRFGRVINADIQPGLHVKWPIADQVRKFDARVISLDAPEERFLTVEKKSMIVDSYAKWRIIDVAKYYTATSGDEIRARRLLEQRINEGLRNQFAQRSLQEVVSGERNQLMVDLTKQLNGFTQTSLGIEIVDVRLKRIDLPAEVSAPVFSRMAAEREREAREHRAKGKEQAEIIRADADRQQTVILAQAYRDAEMLRGEGDAEAAAIYAAAYSKDSEFYAFMRSLEAYKQAFNSKDDVLLVDPGSDFFRYLKDAAGGQ